MQFCVCELLQLLQIMVRTCIEPTILQCTNIYIIVEYDWKDKLVIKNGNNKGANSRCGVGTEFGKGCPLTKS